MQGLFSSTMSYGYLGSPTRITQLPMHFMLKGIKKISEIKAILRLYIFKGLV